MLVTPYGAYHRTALQFHIFIVGGFGRGGVALAGGGGWKGVCFQCITIVPPHMDVDIAKDSNSVRPAEALKQKIQRGQLKAWSQPTGVFWGIIMSQSFKL